MFICVASNTASRIMHPVFTPFRKIQEPANVMKGVKNEYRNPVLVALIGLILLGMMLAFYLRMVKEYHLKNRSEDEAVADMLMYAAVVDDGVIDVERTVPLWRHSF